MLSGLHLLLALEHLQDFTYYALPEEPVTIRDIEQLSKDGSGGGVRADGLGGQLTSQVVSEASTCVDQSAKGIEKKNSSNSSKSLSNHPAARIDDSPLPSIGVAAAQLMDVEPEKERWLQLAREWYGAGLAEQPGTGKLHHHLDLLEREVEGEELRGCYHFVKKWVFFYQ